MPEEQLPHMGGIRVKRWYSQQELYDAFESVILVPKKTPCLQPVDCVCIWLKI